VLAVVGLAGLAGVASASQLYVAWGVLGLAMAALLYESAFALVIRAVDDPAVRLHALAAVTVMGGLASTLFLPTLALVTEHAGWRATQLAGALAVALAAVAMQRVVLPRLPQNAVVAAPPAAPRASRRDARFLVLAAAFAAGTVSAMAVTTLLIPLLIARSVPAPLAATALAALGIAQLPGRLWLLRGGAAPSARAFAMLPLALQAAGLVGIAIATNLVWSTASVALFGVGAGLHTLARPWLVQRLYGTAEAGYWNGQLARIQGFGRALGPVLVVVLATTTSAPIVLAAAGAVLLLLAPVAGALLRDPTDPLPGRLSDDAALDA
jgi:hypothetical protein